MTCITSKAGQGGLSRAEAIREYRNYGKVIAYYRGQLLEAEKTRLYSLADSLTKKIDKFETLQASLKYRYFL